MATYKLVNRGCASYLTNGKAKGIKGRVSYGYMYAKEGAKMTQLMDIKIVLVNGETIETTAIIDFKNRKIDIYAGKEKYKPQSGFIPFESVVRVEYTQ